MKKTLLSCAAVALFLTPATQAQDLPKLEQFLADCYRDSAACRLRIGDYVTAANTQKIICLKDVSVREASIEVYRWLRSDETKPMREQPFDDALLAGSTKLYPCEAAAPAGEPPATPPVTPS